MGQRSTANRRQVARGIMEAASRCFGESGYAQITVDDIAHEAGISKPMLYRSFDSKAELYEAVLATHTQEFLERLDAALDRSLIMDRSTSTERLPLLMVFVDYARQRDAGFRLLFESEAIFDPEFSGIVTEFLRTVRTKLLSVRNRRDDDGLTEEVRHTESQLILGSTIVVAGKIAGAQSERERQELVGLYRSMVLPRIAGIGGGGGRVRLKPAS
ncbi:TetR/AcrR family transcriptional regulator [Rothia sp. AR01]|uniref:TetR/AcrR family transcriptional regulator n=1 Tax=Rothia santali TaxID=2949643 RepID=A0A9X2KHV7_9MICC|nr:TetR/AcrR family transcriptional regulator [Rothia santali]MCP3425588.1 TetR/AcrR family transcriptional regulator [Rothia santali]